MEGPHTLKTNRYLRRLERSAEMSAATEAVQAIRTYVPLCLENTCEQMSSLLNLWQKLHERSRDVRIPMSHLGQIYRFPRILVNETRDMGGPYGPGEMRIDVVQEKLRDVNIIAGWYKSRTVRLEYHPCRCLR